MGQSAPFRTLPEGLPSRWVGSSGRSNKETTRFRPYRSCGSGIGEELGADDAAMVHHAARKLGECSNTHQILTSLGYEV